MLLSREKHRLVPLADPLDEESSVPMHLGCEFQKAFTCCKPGISRGKHVAIWRMTDSTISLDFPGVEAEAEAHITFRI